MAAWRSSGRGGGRFRRQLSLAGCCARGVQAEVGGRFERGAAARGDGVLEAGAAQVVARPVEASAEAAPVVLDATEARELRFFNPGPRARPPESLRAESADQLELR